MVRGFKAGAADDRAARSPALSCSGDVASRREMRPAPRQALAPTSYRAPAGSSCRLVAVLGIRSPLLAAAVPLDSR